jgi:hypothetical protein
MKLMYFSFPWSLNTRLLHSSVILIIKGSVSQNVLVFSFLLSVLLLTIFIFIYQCFLSLVGSIYSFRFNVCHLK